MSEQMCAEIQGVKVPVFMVGNVVIPLKAIEGSVGVHEYYGAACNGNTYTFHDKNLDLGMDTLVTYNFDPHATKY